MRKRRGFSLLELMVAMSLLLLVVGLGVLNFRKATAGGGARALAEVVAEELRRTRNLALSSAVPVAMAFRNDGGGATRSFQRLTGASRAAMVWSQAWGAEYKAVVFVGTWAGGSFAAATPTFTQADNFDVSAWLSGVVGTAPNEDSTVAFLPDGHAKANFLAVGGSYRIVVAAGINLAGQVATTFQDPWTVTVTPLGDISVAKGLPLGAGGLEGNAPLPNTVPAPRSPDRDNISPRIVRLRVYPVNNPGIYPSLFKHAIGEALPELYPENDNTDNFRNLGTVTGAIYAVDDDHDPLYCLWSAVPRGGGASGTGTFSYPGWGTMVPHRPGNDELLGVCDWQPPVNADSGNEWRINCEVRDPWGGSASTAFDNTHLQTVSVSSPGKVAFDKYPWDDSAEDAREAVYIMNLDGTSVMRLTNLPDVNESYPDLSPSGDRVLFSCTTDADETSADIYRCTLDGKERVLMAGTDNRDETRPKWSPNGTRYCFYRQWGSSTTEKYLLFTDESRAGGNAPKRVNNSASNMPDVPPSWSPDSRFLAFPKWNSTTDTYDLNIAVANMTANQDTIPARTLCFGNFKDDGLDNDYDIQQVAWSPDGDHIAFIAYKCTGPGPNAASPTDDTYQADTRVWYVNFADRTDPMNSAYTIEGPIGKYASPDKSRGAYSIAYSPGGARLALISNPDNNDYWQLFLCIRQRPDPAQPAQYDGPIRPQQFTDGFDCWNPFFTSNGAYVIVSAGKGTEEYDQVKLYRFYVNDTDIPKRPADVKTLTEVSKDVSTHCVSR